MTKGRSTSVLTVRLPDELATSLRNEARRRKVLLNDYLKSILANHRLPEQKLKEKLHEATEIPAGTPADDFSMIERFFEASPSPVKREKAKAKRKAAKAKRKRQSN